MRTNLSTVLLALGLLCVAPTAFAQDEIPADPESGDVGTESGDIGGETGEVGTEGAGDASALPPAEDTGVAKPISVSLLLGYGVSLEDGGNPWGFGLGLRGGYNLDAIYLGARFVYYFGESESVTVPFAGTIETSINIWELGVEGGYDIDAGGITIRPGLGLGLASVNADAGGMSASESYFFIAPGVSALFDVTDSIFVGADVRFQLIFGDPDTVKGIPLLVNGGMRF